MMDFIIRQAYRFIWVSILWYRITMHFTKARKEPSRKQVVIPKYEKVEDIAKALNYGRSYTPDKMFDIVSDHLTHPRTLQKRIEESADIGDCDDHAIYWCVSLLKSDLARKVWFAFYSMKKDDGTKSAHAICVFVGNDNKFYWADYRNPTRIEALSDFMVDSAAGYLARPIVGAVCCVDGLEQDDTPIFGTIKRLLP